jgi:hypothetical protein
MIAGWPVRTIRTFSKDVVQPGAAGSCHHMSPIWQASRLPRTLTAGSLGANTTHGTRRAWSIAGFRSLIVYYAAGPITSSTDSSAVGTVWESRSTRNRLLCHSIKGTTQQKFIIFNLNFILEKVWRVWYGPVCPGGLKMGFSIIPYHNTSLFSTMRTNWLFLY